MEAKGNPPDIWIGLDEPSSRRGTYDGEARVKYPTIAAREEFETRSHICLATER